MKSLASFLSYLLHPILSPLISLFLLFHLPIYHNYRFPDSFFNFIYLTVLINLVLIPLGISYYLKNKGLIHSLSMERVEERKIPFLLTAMLYGLTYWLFESISLPELYLKIFKAASLVVVALSVLAFLNIKWSVHLSAMGSLTGILVVVGQSYALKVLPLLIASILLSGILASARLSLKAHSFKEIIFGFLLGCGTQLSILI